MKNTDTARDKGYDAGKKISGIKRHVAVDSNGLPHALSVTTANVSDRAGALSMVEAWRGQLTKVETVMVDAGYSGGSFAAEIKDKINANVEVIKRSEPHAFKVMPKRWVVERSFAWLDKCHRLWKNCEHTLHTSLQMMVLAFVALLLKRL